VGSSPPRYPDLGEEASLNPFCPSPYAHAPLILNSGFKKSNTYPPRGRDRRALVASNLEVAALRSHGVHSHVHYDEPSFVSATPGLAVPTTGRDRFNFAFFARDPEKEFFTSLSFRLPGGRGTGVQFRASPPLVCPGFIPLTTLGLPSRTPQHHQHHRRRRPPSPNPGEHIRPLPLTPRDHRRPHPAPATTPGPPEDPRAVRRTTN